MIEFLSYPCGGESNPPDAGWSTPFASFHAYPSIYALGHPALGELLLDPVLVEEKVDGSQFSWCADVGEHGTLELRCRSKGAAILLDAPEKMFAAAVATAQDLFTHGLLTPGWTYRAEYLAKPHHNALAYDRIPRRHLALFDVGTGLAQFLTWDQKAAEAERLGLEVMPRLFQGPLDTTAQFRDFLATPSFLGGQRVEGVVVKNYARFGRDAKVLMGKYVSEAFKEVHAAEWKTANPTSGDVVQTLIARYRTPARWQKALQHLRETGQVEDSPRDIGLLIRETPEDLLRECGEEVRDALFAWAWPKIRRGTCAGLAEWYKEQLCAKQFAKETP